MARKGGPALYELLSHSKGVSGAGGAVPPSASRPPFSGAQTQVIAWVVVGVVAVVIAYLIGVSRGERLGRAQLAEERAQEMRLQTDARPDVGAADGSPAPSQMASATGAGARTGASENRSQVEGNGIARGQALQEGPLPPLPRGVEPRQPGYKYIFIAGGISESGAVDIAEFCRGKGLDARVIPIQNTRLFEVVVLPGFLESERSGATVTRLEERIRQIGLLYRGLARGNSDFGDMYHRLYQP
jgi:hypothetical protein